jgi:hypothetical protein
MTPLDVRGGLNLQGAHAHILENLPCKPVHGQLHDQQASQLII